MVVRKKKVKRVKKTTKRNKKVVKKHHRKPHLTAENIIEEVEDESAIKERLLNIQYNSDLPRFDQEKEPSLEIF